MNILFIGNSHTYYHGMPYQCRELLAALGVDARVVMITEGGKTLEWHREFPSTNQALRYDHWDHIVLQQATHPWPGEDTLYEGVEGLLQLIPEGRAVWLYKTWCEKDKPENQAFIDTSFESVSAALNIPVIPVADAWHEVERRDPGHDLYHIDGEHAGRAGSYLTALCMARTFSGKSVLGLPSTLRYGNRIINRVPLEAARLYQETADALIKQTEKH